MAARYQHSVTLLGKLVVGDPIVLPVQLASVGVFMQVSGEVRGSQSMTPIGTFKYITWLQEKFQPHSIHMCGENELLVRRLLNWTPGHTVHCGVMMFDK